jgi:hypothetical protein
VRRVTTGAVAVLLLWACSSGPPAEDQAACDAYAEAVARAEARTTTDEQLFSDLEGAWLAAGSDRLDDLLDDLLHFIEAENRVDQRTVNLIRDWCGLD